MSWIDSWRHRLQTMLGRRQFEEDLSAEMEFHRRMEMESQLSSGVDPQEATYAARRKIGSTAYYQDEVRRAAGLERLDSIRQDLRFAFRGLRREPMLALFVVLTLALGIGANASIFSVVDRLLLRGPDHVVHPDQLVRFYDVEQPKGRQESRTSYMGYAAYRAIAETSTLEGAAAYSLRSWTSGVGIE
ncbi:MAG: permease prefix domain 1-containing protein, partial [Gemmatimonadota bacterium]